MPNESLLKLREPPHPKSRTAPTLDRLPLKDYKMLNTALKLGDESGKIKSSLGRLRRRTPTNERVGAQVLLNKVRFPAVDGSVLIRASPVWACRPAEYAGGAQCRSGERYQGLGRALSMRVDFYGVYRPVAGGKTMEFEMKPAATLRELLDAIVARFPALRADLLDRDGMLYPWIPIYVNGRNPRLQANGLDLPLKGTEIISLFSPIASGKINVEEAKNIMEG